MMDGIATSSYATLASSNIRALRCPVRGSLGSGHLAHRRSGGVRTWALSLSGDAGDEVSAVPWRTLERYTSDLDEALRWIGRPTVVIAHSLGGAVTQNLLRRGRRPAGTVLLCSVPPYGLWRASMEMLALKPDLWQAMAFFSTFGLKWTDMTVLRRHLFPGGIDNGAFARLCAKLQDESFFAMGAVMGWRPIAPLPLSDVDVLVIGGAKDCYIPETDVRLTAAYYGVDPHILEGAGHMLMLEAAGKDASQIILDWLPGLRITRH